MLASVRYLLLQIRNEDDPMAAHEVAAFCWALECEKSQIAICDLLTTAPEAAQLAACDIVLIGGSGHYSTRVDADWLDRTFDALRDIHARKIPMFGSCWGFQALARAFGGTVIRDPVKAELGTLEIELSEEGQNDPVFGPLGQRFIVPIGHEDSVVELPGNCTLLGKSAKANQVFRFEDAPIYATQFHPELDQNGLIDRIRVYPQYVEDITNSTFEEFVGQCQPTPKMKEIMPRFVKLVLTG